MYMSNMKPLPLAHMQEDNTQKRLPAILPRNTDVQTQGPAFSQTSTQANQRQRRGPAVVAACESCRKRRVKCNGERPVCHACQSKNLVCQYITEKAESRTAAMKRKYNEMELQVEHLNHNHDVLNDLIRALHCGSEAQNTALIRHIQSFKDAESAIRSISATSSSSKSSPEAQESNETYKKIYELLQSGSEHEASTVFKRIRDDNTPGKILSDSKTRGEAADLLLQLALVPETRLRYEFPYSSALPDNLIQDNPYLDSVVYEATTLYSQNKPSKALTQSGNGSAVLVHQNSEEYQNSYLKPFHAAQVVDSLLVDANPSAWTDVCDENVLMRDLLGVFFRCEYHFTMAFQKDYFLQDMVAQREEFCSSLLVNIVLGYACVCYPRFSDRAMYWNPKTLQYQFIAEAKRLWELEAKQACITTIQAGILFNVYHNLCGLDEIGQAYRLQAIVLAHQLGLYEKRARYCSSKRMQDGFDFTAWALYNWESLVGFSFMLCPLLKEPPNRPLPNPRSNPQWYGEIYIRYPLSRSLVPMLFGQVFAAKSQFRIIMNEFCRIAYSDGGQGVVLLATANRLYSKLQHWYQALPDCLQPKLIVLPAHLQLHMYYHNLILSLYEPSLEVNAMQTPSPQEIVTDTNKSLHTLIRLYYLRHGFEAMDLFIVIPLVLIGFKCLDTITDQTPHAELEALRSTLMLITKGLANQRRNHYLAEALFRVIRGRMRPQEAGLLREVVDLEDDDAAEQTKMRQAVRSEWPVSVVKKKEDLDSLVLKNLVENYAGLNINTESRPPSSVSGEQ